MAISFVRFTVFSGGPARREGLRLPVSRRTTQRASAAPVEPEMRDTRNP